MDRAAAISAIRQVFAQYRGKRRGDAKMLKQLTDGKLYELYVLSHLVENLAKRGFTLVFKGTTLKFKASPGQIHLTDPHFEVFSPGSGTVDFRIFVDIEFQTLGHSKAGAADDSARHELDIVVVAASTNGYPPHDDIALGVECKAVANFSKHLVREALGVRRELSLLVKRQNSTLTSAGGSPGVTITADPASEFWFAFIDAKGLNYSQSPATYGIDFFHLEP